MKLVTLPIANAPHNNTTFDSKVSKLIRFNNKLVEILSDPIKDNRLRYLRRKQLPPRGRTMEPVFCFNKGFIGHLWGYIQSCLGTAALNSLLKDQKERAVDTFRDI